MKKSLKAILILAGAVLATTGAQAVGNLTEDISVTVGSGTGDEIAVVSSVSALGAVIAGDYTYTYALTQVAGSGGIDAFTVYSLGNPFTSLAVTGVTDPNSNWSGGVNGGHVAWSVNLNPVVDQALPLSFSYSSPDGPVENGYAGAADGGTYAPGTLSSSNEIWVPNLPAVPDGGLTVTLLGGALLGLGALRRKIGC
jgi:hypothetical protein